jgi:hypothetical protein
LLRSQAETIGLLRTRLQDEGGKGSSSDDENNRAPIRSHTIARPRKIFGGMPGLDPGIHDDSQDADALRKPAVATPVHGLPGLAAEPARALAARDRAACGPVAPPDGLYLMRVDY